MDSIKRYLTGWKTIPNFISFFRILLIPVFGVLFHKGELVWALIVIVVSGLQPDKRAGQNA